MPSFRFLFQSSKSSIFSREIVGVIEMQSVNKKAISRTYGRGMGWGWAFSSNDFVEDFSRDQIENALAGLCREVLP